mgnify:CR=1 FL=1
MIVLSQYGANMRFGLGEGSPAETAANWAGWYALPALRELRSPQRTVVVLRIARVGLTSAPTACCGVTKQKSRSSSSQSESTSQSVHTLIALKLCRERPRGVGWQAVRWRGNERIGVCAPAATKRQTPKT